MNKIIRIQAKSTKFEIDEQIDEKNAVKRLEQIRNYALGKPVLTRNKKKRYFPEKLSVTTSVINPTLF